MKDARGHGSELHGGLPVQQSKGFSNPPSPLTARGRGIMPSKPYRDSPPAPAQQHTDTGRTVFGLRQRLAQADSPGRAHAILQAIKNFAGG